MAEHPEVVALVLLAAVAGLLLVTRLTSVPYPILLFLGGGALGLVPGMPSLELAPELVLLGILPPLLFASAFNSSVRELRDSARPVTLASTLLVAATTGGVAVVAHVAVDLDWAIAFVLGAIVSPTDPIAATAIASRVGAPQRLVSFLESESLVNDATALVLYRVALGAAIAGTFSVLDAFGDFVVGAALGILVGGLVGEAAQRVLARIDDAPLASVLSVVFAYLAYLPVEALHGSAVLAAVTAGLVVGWRSPVSMSPSVRLAGRGFWEALSYLLNALVFIVVGLQLPVVLDALEDRSTGALLADAAAVSAAVIGLRFLWLFTAPYAVRALDRRPQQRARRVGWRERVVVGWSGMRGVVSLAAALAVPNSVADRDLVLVMTYGVIFFTLVVQGLTLPALIRLLGVQDDGSGSVAEASARRRAAEAALLRLDELHAEGTMLDFTYERVHGLYEHRRKRWAARADGTGTELEERADGFKALQRELLLAQRVAVLELHGSGELGAEELRRIERDLDLDHARLEE